ncbi:MAG: hypothetical protein JXR70_05575 [Spirochaetales bacterium]|nr:hypothetical protein [Spirochaetales bacterium]
MKFMKYFVLFLLCLLIFSCSMKQSMGIQLDGSGDVVFKVVLEKVFVQYIMDLAEATMDYDDVSELEKKAVFDIGEISSRLRERTGVVLEKINSLDRGQLELQFKFEHINELLYPQDSPVKRSNLVSFSDENGVKNFRINLTKSNYDHLFELFPSLKNPVFESLAPQPGEDVSREEYRDVIEFAMDTPGLIALDRSSLDLWISVQGQILSHVGGEQEGSKLHYTIPLIDLVVLEKPVVLEVKFK